MVLLLGGVAVDFGAAAVVPPALLSLWANPCPVKYHASRRTTSPAAITIVAARPFVSTFPLLSNLWGNRSPCKNTAHPDCEHFRRCVLSEREGRVGFGFATTYLTKSSPYPTPSNPTILHSSRETGDRDPGLVVLYPTQDIVVRDWQSSRVWRALLLPYASGRPREAGTVSCLPHTSLHQASRALRKAFTGIRQNSGSCPSLLRHTCASL